MHVICPGFSADCLETLEEVQLQYKAVFLEAGGKEFAYVPALNSEPYHIQALSRIIVRHCQGWPECSGERDQETVINELKATQARADKLSNDRY